MKKGNPFNDPFRPPPQAPPAEKSDLYEKLNALRYSLNWFDKEVKDALIELIDMLLEKEVEEK